MSPSPGEREKTTRMMKMESVTLEQQCQQEDPRSHLIHFIEHHTIFSRKISMSSSCANLFCVYIISSLGGVARRKGKSAKIWIISRQM